MGCFRYICVFSTFFCLSLSAQITWPPDLSRLVVVGDSISAGVQNFSLEKDQQVHGFASVVARQAHVSLTLPLVPYPGVPNTLELTSFNPITIVPVNGTLPPIPRVDPCGQPTNVSVPGVTLSQALTIKPTPPSPSDSAVQSWADIVLGFPNPFGAAAGCAITPSAPSTEIQQAVALHPTAVITWLGNNDVLVPAMIGQMGLLTPVSDFATEYEQLLDQLNQAHAPIMTANIPDVTLVAFFTPVSAVAAQNHVSPAYAAQKIGTGPNDYLRPTAVPLANAILQGQSSGPLPAACPAPTALQLLTPQIPCVLTASDAQTVRQTVAAYNAIITLESLLHGAPVVDIYTLLEQLGSNGYQVNNKHLTTAMLGGIFSLDGIHPTNTAYAIIANTFINTMNTWWGTHVIPANIDEIAAKDPYVPSVKLNYVP